MTRIKKEEEKNVPVLLPPNAGGEILSQYLGDPDADATERLANRTPYRLDFLRVVSYIASIIPQHQKSKNLVARIIGTRYMCDSKQLTGACDIDFSKSINNQLLIKNSHVQNMKF